MKPITPWTHSTASSDAAAVRTRHVAVAPGEDQRPIVSATSTKTAQAWTLATWSGSSPVRGESTSPLCGPEPVTTVPR